MSSSRHNNRARELAADVHELYMLRLVSRSTTKGVQHDNMTLALAAKEQVSPHAVRQDPETPSSLQGAHLNAKKEAETRDVWRKGTRTLLVSVVRGHLIAKFQL